MKEKIDEAIVRTYESGSVAQELLDPLRLNEIGEYSVQRRALVLSPAAAVEMVFKAYDPEAQDKFRQGLTEAMRRWDKGELESEIYTRLIYLCGDTKNIAALPLLIETTQKKELNLDDEKDRAVMRATVGTIKWLSEFVDEDTQQKNMDHLKKLCYDPYYEKLMGMMMNGICTFRPEEFPHLFPRFLEIYQEHPEFHELDACIRESIRVVTPDKMKRLLSELTDEARTLVEKELSASG